MTVTVAIHVDRLWWHRLALQEDRLSYITALCAGFPQGLHGWYCHSALGLYAAVLCS